MGVIQDKRIHEVTLYVVKGFTDVYIGYVKEMPGIITQAKTVKLLEEETSKSINVFWNEFPEVHNKLFPKHLIWEDNIPSAQKMRYRIIKTLIPTM